MEKKGKIINKYFYLLLLTTIVVLIINIAIGEKQDKIYLQDANKLSLAEKYLKEKNYSQAEPLLAELSIKHPESYQIQWYYGKCLANKGEYDKAKTYYDLSRKIAPLVVKDSSFLIELGEIEYKLQNYETASKYLQVARLQGLSSSDAQKVEVMLNELNNSL